MAARPASDHHTPGRARQGNRSGSAGVTTTRHRHGGEHAASSGGGGAALVALVVMTGCSGDSGGGGLGRRRHPGSARRPTGPRPSRPRPRPARPATRRRTPRRASRLGRHAASQVGLVDLGNRIIRTANVDLEVGEGKLNATINQATDIVRRAKGIYVGSSTSVPSGEPASGQVTFRVPVDAFRAVLRELKGLGTYRGEKSSTEDVTSQYIDLNGQLVAWQAQSASTCGCSTGPGRLPNVIAVQNQLQQVQSNIERLQGQLDYLEDQTSFSTIVLQLSEPGAAGPAGEPRGRLARAWATAVVPASG